MTLATVPALGEAIQLKIKSFRWSADLEKGQTVKVTNNFGDIRVKNSKRGGLGISAIIQNLQDGQDYPRVNISKTGKGYQVNVNHLTKRNETRDYKGRVDVTLLVPLQTSLVAETVFGNIYGRFKGEIVASTQSGNLNIDSTGSINAITASGSITAWIKNSQLPLALKFETITGNITVKLSNSANISIHAMTNGRRSMISPFDSEAPIRSNNNVLTWKLGEGSNDLNIESKSGDVQIFVSKSLEPSGLAATATAPVAPEVIKRDLRSLPRSQFWTPGQPIKEVPKN